MSTARHCKHCWGGCSGTCLRTVGGTCIHKPAPKLNLTFYERVMLLGNRRFWRRVIWGTGVPKMGRGTGLSGD
jgi:hypothetical protein